MLRNKGPAFNKHLGFAWVTWGLVDAVGSIGGCLFITMVTMAELEPKMLGEGASPDGVIIREEEAEDGGRSSKRISGSEKKARQLEKPQILSNWSIGFAVAACPSMRQNIPCFYGSLVEDNDFTWFVGNLAFSPFCWNNFSAMLSARLCIALRKVKLTHLHRIRLGFLECIVQFKSSHCNSMDSDFGSKWFFIS